MLRELDRSSAEDRLVLDIVYRIAANKIPNCQPRKIMQYEGHHQIYHIPILEDSYDASETIKVVGQCTIEFQSYYFQISDPYSFSGIRTEEIILGYGEELGILAVANIHHVRSIVRRMIRSYTPIHNQKVNSAVKSAIEKMSVKTDNSPSIGGLDNPITGKEPRLQRHRYEDKE